MDIIHRYDRSQPFEGRGYSTADEAALALREGNQRFREMAVRVQGVMAGGDEGRPILVVSNPLALGFSPVAGQVPVQRPFGIVLGCSDARAPIERIFDHSYNELFVVRVAGNVLGTECLGSIEYGAIHFAESVRLVVVLGHTNCGAVGAAVDLYLDPVAYGTIAGTQSLRSIVDRISVVVRLAAKSLEDRCGPGLSSDPGYKAALWQMSVYLNAALTAHDLSKELQESIAEGMQVVYGVFDLPTQRVEASPGADDTFAPAPTTSGEFAALADRLVASILDRGVLNRAYA